MIDCQRILCPIDFSEHSDHALRYAMKMAAWYKAELHVLHVMPPAPPPTISPIGEAERRQAERRLAEAIERWRDRNVTITSELLESAEAAGRILERADAIDADLIVAGSHGRTGVGRLLLGSVVSPLLHSGRRPILVIPARLDRMLAEGAACFGRILCAVDFGAPSLTALAQALAMAEETDARLTLLNVIDVPPELNEPPAPPDFDVERARAKVEADRMARLHALVPEHARDYCTVDAAVVDGGVSRQILRLAERDNADLIVIGVHGRGALDLAVFGSNAKDVIARAHCPVLVVPAGGRRALRAVS